MTYCAQADLTERLSSDGLLQLTDDENTGAVNTDRVNRAIASAQEEIDGYLRGRYTLPLSPVPALIQRLAVDIAVYRLHRRRNLLLKLEGLEELYRAAVSTLGKLQSGDMLLESATGIAQAPTSAQCNKTRRDRMFSKRRLEDY